MRGSHFFLKASTLLYSDDESSVFSVDMMPAVVKRETNLGDA